MRWFFLACQFTISGASAWILYLIFGLPAPFVLVSLIASQTVFLLFAIDVVNRRTEMTSLNRLAKEVTIVARHVAKLSAKVAASEDAVDDAIGRIGATLPRLERSNATRGQELLDIRAILNQLTITICIQDLQLMSAEPPKWLVDENAVALTNRWKATS